MTIREALSRVGSTVNPSSGTRFRPFFSSPTFENWQSEWLQLVLQGRPARPAAQVLPDDGEEMELVQRDLIEIRIALGLPAGSPAEHHISGSRAKAGPP